MRSWLDWMRLPVLALAIACAGCDSPRTPLNADDIERAARDTAGIASEASFLVDQIEQGNVGANYVWVHQQALLVQSGKTGEPLQKPVPPDLRERQQKCIAASARLETALGQIGFAMTDPRELHQLRQVFAAVKSQAQALEGDK